MAQAAALDDMVSVDTLKGLDALSRTFATDPASVRLARAELDRWSESLERSVFNQARLLVSEVVSGCVIQSGGATTKELIALDISLTATALRVEVSHRCAAPVPQTAEPDEPSGGWTIYLLGELADRWGVRGREKRSTVWFEIDRG